MNSIAEIRTQVETALANRIPSALTFFQNQSPLRTVPTGILELDDRIGGIPLGGLTEICGPISSGRTSLLISLLAEFSHTQGVCALVDAGDSFHPQSAVAAGVDLTQLLWVRCRGEGSAASVPSSSKRKPTKGDMYYTVAEKSIRVTDLLLRSGGFGLVVIDLADIPSFVSRRVPLTSWFRFRRSIEDTPTALIVLEQEPHARTCASLVLQLQPTQSQWTHSSSKNECVNVSCRVSGERDPSRSPFTNLLQGISAELKVLRSSRQASAVLRDEPHASTNSELKTVTTWVQKINVQQ